MPGERITEADLTDKFKCSRGPAREAIVQLCKEGFISIAENKGAVVTKISPEEIDDYYQILSLLEGKAVELATSNLTDNDFEKLHLINKSLKELVYDDPDYLDEWCVRNSAFHEIFRIRCGNSKMRLVIKEIREKIYRYRYRSLLSTENEKYIYDHALILKHVMDGNSVAAGKEMEQHILRAKNVLKKFLSYNKII